jgi:hypothetical protein
MIRVYLQQLWWVSSSYRCKSNVNQLTGYLRHFSAFSIRCGETEKDTGDDLASCSTGSQIFT